MASKPAPTDALTQGQAPVQSGRLWSVDALRGLLIVLMALDHANYFVAQKHPAGEFWGGPFPVYDSPGPFLARLATHPAAPGFFFLMGCGMSLYAAGRRRRGWSEWAIARHFLVRGALLILLQFTLVNLAWSLTPWGWTTETYAGVLFGLGAAMIFAAALLRVGSRALLVLSATVIPLVALAGPDPGQWGRPYPEVVHLLLVPGGSAHLWVNYPVLPWLGLVIFGMAFGRWLLADQRRGAVRALWLGAALLVVFVVLRATDGFGNVRPRSGDTWIDFLNVVKYPPSITFLSLTMGLNLITVGIIGRAGEAGSRFLAPLAVFGRTPLLFYLLHLFLYAGLGRALAPRGSTIAAMLPLWLLGLGLLYPVCLLYGRVKEAASPRSVLRLL
jgi:uncharacterized membrane protein